MDIRDIIYNIKSCIPVMYNIVFIKLWNVHAFAFPCVNSFLNVSQFIKSYPQGTFSIHFSFKNSVRNFSAWFLPFGDHFILCLEILSKRLHFTVNTLKDYTPVSMFCPQSDPLPISFPDKLLFDMHSHNSNLVSEPVSREMVCVHVTWTLTFIFLVLKV